MRGLFYLVVIGTVLWVLAGAVGNAINGWAGVNSASRVSPALGAEVEAALRLTPDQADIAETLASSNLWNAQANKANAEARTIEDDRQAKKYGYGGLAAADLLGAVGGIQGAFVCVTLPLAVAF